MNTQKHYDVVIIGAGMSGLAAGIRLAHFGKKVCIFERHNAVGGLNGFYSRNGRKYDVGLHALTNYVEPSVKGTALGKIFRQLRIDRAELDLYPQKRSRVSFGPRGELNLRFGNDPGLLESEVATVFPAEAERFRAFVRFLRQFDDTTLDPVPQSSRAVLREHLADPLLQEMLLCAVMFYGSSEENDVDFSQFVVLFKAIFLEGLGRPFEGVRAIVRVLLEKYREAGGERRMKCGVKRLLTDGSRVSAVQLDNGKVITADLVISSIGASETRRLCSNQPDTESQKTTGGEPPGRLSFVETMLVLSQPPAALGWGEDTVVFFNDSPRFIYERPVDAVDVRSGVLCIPNNFRYPPERALPEGMIRCTCLANYDRWTGLPDERYYAQKREWFPRIFESARRFMPPLDSARLADCTVDTDMFTPRTIEQFTGRLGGAIYGAPRKHRRGETAFANLVLCGTDQGYLGITGALLSGISMANLHVLARG